MRTLAAVSTGATSPFAFRELELDEPRPDELLVRIQAVGVCHTDLAIRAMWPQGAPIVLGHEGAGVVERVGAQVTDVAPGDKVVISFASCGACARCTSGRPAYCARFQQLNISGSRPDGSATHTGADGAVSASFFGQSSFARHALTARRNAVVVDPTVDLSLVAAFGCGVQTGAGAVLNVLQPSPRSRLVVFGLGGVGMAAVMAAAALGVQQVVGVDLAASRRATALEVGATAVLDGADECLLDALRKATGGGASHALDTTAVPGVVRTAAQALAALGTLAVVGTGADITLDTGDLIGGGKTIRGCIEGDADPQELIPRLVAWHQDGRLPMEKVVRTFPLEQLNEAVAQMRDGSVIKPVLLPAS
jgi:aryl-alcohol dehydrogenase